MFASPGGYIHVVRDARVVVQTFNIGSVMLSRPWLLRIADIRISGYFLIIHSFMLLGTIRLLFILYILESTFLSLSTSKSDTANPTKTDDKDSVS
jgi:hypothetical protein